MSVELNTRHIQRLDEKPLNEMIERSKTAHAKVVRGGGAGEEMRGWVNLPNDYDREEFARIKTAAGWIRENCDALVVIGIGGSYLGAAAVTGALADPDDKMKIIFVGNSASARELKKALAAIDGKSWAINVVSKSGTTLEPALAFRFFREKLERQYGFDGACERIFATTDAKKGALKQLADENGYQAFVVPDNIGGRYSVLTAVGLLPIAVAGIDIDELMDGARAAAKDCGPADNPSVNYAIIRNIMYHRYGVENLVSFEPSLKMFAEWWKQLFGESEGKNGQGLLPDSMTFTTDLHSLGQYVQDGKKQLFETFIRIKEPLEKLPIPADAKNLDGLNYLAGREISEVNDAAFDATVEAHVSGGVSVIILELDRLDAKNLGYLIYFFEFACAVSAYILEPDGNPFNQPGVEAYKKNMFEILGKPE